MEWGHRDTDLSRDEVQLKDSLRLRLILLVTGFIILTALSLAYLYSQNGDHTTLEHYSRQRLLQERLQSAALFQGISSAQRDLRILEHSPVLISLLKTLQKSPNSPESTRWKKRLTETFVSYTASSPDFMQMRLIGVHNGGHEIVRVDRVDNKIVVIPKQRLQNKSHRDYYQDTIRMGPGAMYTSAINLNREFGKISIPYTPTIRVAIPLYLDADKVFAILIINIDLTHAFNSIKKQVEPGSSLYVINQTGDYLVNPDKSKEFAFDFDRQARIQNDFPSLINNLKSINKNGFDQEISLNGKKQFMHAFLLADSSNIGTNRMIAIQLIPEKVLFKEIHNTMTTANIFALIITLLSIFIALLFARNLLSPIHFLTKAATAAAKGKYTHSDFPEQKNEIGLLSRSFREMISKIEQRESTIRDDQARYKAIFSGADAIIAIIDNDGHIEEANDAFCDMLGINHEDIQQYNITDIIVEQSSNVDFINSPCKNCNFNQLCVGEVKLCSTDGTIIPATSALSGFSTATGEHNAVYMYDLRPQRAAEEERMNLLLQLRQSQKLESIGLLVTGIAHDFNNVLSCISGYSDLLLSTDDIDTESRNTYLREILDSSDKAREMIKNLMLFTRNASIQFHTDDVQKTIMDIISVLEHALTSRIILTHDIDINDISIEIAPFQLQQLILNLCINSRDAMDGKGEIHIDAHIVDVTHSQCSSCDAAFTGQYIALTVKDHGPGIESDMVRKLFEPFFTTKEGDKGTGLGLYMVNNIVHDIGGHLVVDTQQGEYCSFTLYLPYTQGNRNDMFHTPTKMGSSAA